MSSALSCQELSFVGGQHYNYPYPVPTSADCVDVSKETVLSLWDAGPLDNTACQHEPPQQENILIDYDGRWNTHLSPHLQRNKQLQDTLLQKEEELARLHEENSKLKEFLNSSLVKCLEEKTKIIVSDEPSYGRKGRKRMACDDTQLCGGHILAEGQRGKRTCRNLSLEYCSTEDLAEANPIDSWVLETLGLKDKNTTESSDIYRSTCYAPAYNIMHHSALQKDGNGAPSFYNPIIPSQVESHYLISAEDPTNNSPQHTLSHSRADLAFSMSLSPTSSVRTHSFPQGQAFVRRDMQGSWNFTWVPKQTQ